MEVRRVQDQKAEQRRLQREEQKRIKENRKSTSSRSSSSSSSTGGRIVDKLLGTIRDGFSSRKSPDSIGDTTDSDYGSRPTSPGPDDDGSGFTRGTPMRKSWQKFEQLNSITENGSESRARGSAENDDTRSVSSGVSSQGTWGSTGSRDDTSPSNTLNSSGRKVRSQQRPRSADDDSLFDMLLQGNDEEALEKFEHFKREGSIRRSGRKSRRKAELVSSDSRERMDSPAGSPMVSRRNSKVDDQTDGKKDALSPDNGQIPSGGLRRHRSLLDGNQQDAIALRALQRRERQNEYEEDTTNNNTSTSPTESSNNSDLSVRGLRRSRSESATTSMMSEVMKGIDQEVSDTSYEQSKSRVDSISDDMDLSQLKADKRSSSSDLTREVSLEATSEFKT